MGGWHSRKFTICRWECCFGSTLLAWQEVCSLEEVIVFLRSRGNNSGVAVKKRSNVIEFLSTLIGQPLLVFVLGIVFTPALMVLSVLYLG